MRTVGAITAGLAGLVLAAALSYFALQLITQPVGLSTVSATTGDRLVATPRRPRAAVKHRAKPRSDDSSSAPAAPAPATPAPTQPDDRASGGDDSSGRDESSGEDHHSGEDDDHDGDHDD